jgi:type II secretory pathway component PulF
MSTTTPEFHQANPAKRGNVFTWIATILACAYVIWTGVMLYMSTPKFMDMYISMGVELPLSTKLVIGFYRPGYPLLFGGATVLLIGKQFSVREKWRNLSITLATVVVMAILGNWIVQALYRPIFDLAEKLNK